MSAAIRCLLLVSAFSSDFGRCRCPEADSEHPKDPYSFYRCGVERRCPPETAFDGPKLGCTREKWTSMAERPKGRFKRSAEARPKVVCYYISWGVYRNETARLGPDDIDPFLCTHLIYAFAKLDESSLLMTPADSNADIKLASYQKVVEAKKTNPKLKVLLALGGWVDSEGDKYSRLVNDSDKRKRFVKEAVATLKKHGFDGLDLDWEYPVCWQGQCHKGPKSDKERFSDLVKELRKAFDDEKPKLLLTAAVVAGKALADKAYDAKSLAKNLDFVNVMTYDFHNFMDNKTGHHAPFEYRQGDSDKYANVMASMKYWSDERGVPKKKLVLGVPAYGRSYTLADPSLHDLDAPVTGPGTKGEFTEESGHLSYLEIRERIVRRGWKVVRVPRVGPYAYRGDQWVGFDDPVSVKEKALFAKNKGYGGVMLWELSGDDFRGMWDDRKHPIVTSLKEGLESGVRGSASGFALVLSVLLCHSVSAEFLW